MALATTKIVSALDCPDPRALAEFYRSLLGWTVTIDTDDWMELSRDERQAIAFQRAPEFVPRSWPSESVHAHLDIYVPDLDEGERIALDVGALRVDDSASTKSFRVYRDPAGHHFCLCAA